MRSTEESTDTFGKLGPKVEQPSKPVDTWKPTSNPVIQKNQDGKLRTNIPDRSPAIFSPWKGIK